METTQANKVQEYHVRQFAHQFGYTMHDHGECLELRGQTINKAMTFFRDGRPTTFTETTRRDFTSFMDY